MRLMRAMLRRLARGAMHAALQGMLPGSARCFPRLGPSQARMALDLFPVVMQCRLDGREAATPAHRRRVAHTVSRPVVVKAQIRLVLRLVLETGAPMGIFSSGVDDGQVSLQHENSFG